jgi:hypothetical protein
MSNRLRLSVPSRTSPSCARTSSALYTYPSSPPVQVAAIWRRVFAYSDVSRTFLTMFSKRLVTSRTGQPRVYVTKPSRIARHTRTMPGFICDAAITRSTHFVRFVCSRVSPRVCFLVFFRSFINPPVVARARRVAELRFHGRWRRAGGWLPSAAR